MARLDPLFYRPGTMRIVLQEFFIVIGLDNKGLHLPQALNRQTSRVPQVGHIAKRTRSSMKSITHRLDCIVRHGKTLDRYITDREARASPENPPVTMLA